MSMIQSVLSGALASIPDGLEAWNKRKSPSWHGHFLVIITICASIIIIKNLFILAQKIVKFLKENCFKKKIPPQIPLMALSTETTPPNHHKASENKKEDSTASSSGASSNLKLAVSIPPSPTHTPSETSDSNPLISEEGRSAANSPTYRLPGNIPEKLAVDDLDSLANLTARIDAKMATPRLGVSKQKREEMLKQAVKEFKTKNKTIFENSGKYYVRDRKVDAVNSLLKIDNPFGKCVTADNTTDVDMMMNYIISYKRNEAKLPSVDNAEKPEFELAAYCYIKYHLKEKTDTQGWWHRFIWFDEKSTININTVSVKDLIAKLLSWYGERIVARLLPSTPTPPRPTGPIPWAARPRSATFDSASAPNTPTAVPATLTPKGTSSVPIGTGKPPPIPPRKPSLPGSSTAPKPAAAAATTPSQPSDSGKKKKSGFFSFT